MMQLTEEQRKALIEWIEEGLLCAEEFGFKGNVRKCMEIALAALTAKPAEWPEIPFTFEELKRMHGEHFARGYVMGWERKSDSVSMKGELYTAPPVAALRLPEKCNRMSADYDDDSLLDIMFADGFDACLAEVKRLNATAPEEKQQ